MKDSEQYYHQHYYDKMVRSLNMVPLKVTNDVLHIRSENIGVVARILAKGMSYVVANGLNITSSTFKAIADDIYVSKIYIDDPVEYKEELDSHMLEISVRSHTQKWGPDKYLDLFVDSDCAYKNFVITKDDLNKLFNTINSNLTTDEIAYMLLHNIDLNSLYCFATTLIK